MPSPRGLIPRTVYPRTLIQTPPINERGSDTVAVCCAGPSFDADKIPADADTCAVSTAIRVMPQPSCWVFIDIPNIGYGPDQGWGAIHDPAVTKVTCLRYNPNLRNEQAMMFVPYNSNEKQDEGRSFMDGRSELLHAWQLSALLAVQYLCVFAGYTTLIFMGMDLNTRVVGSTDDVRYVIADGYCYDGPRRTRQRELQEQNANHANCLSTLKAWHPIAQAKGVRWLSATPGSPIEEFMEAM